MTQEVPPVAADEYVQSMQCCHAQEFQTGLTFAEVPREYSTSKSSACLCTAKTGTRRARYGRNQGRAALCDVHCGIADL